MKGFVRGIFYRANETNPKHDALMEAFFNRAAKKHEREVLRDEDLIRSLTRPFGAL